MRDERFERHMPLFGPDGQEKIRSTRVTVIGVGGVGSHVVQQLSLLGVRDFRLVEPEELDGTNRNRFVGACHDDPVPGTSKLWIAERLIRCVEPDAEVELVPHRLVSTPGYDATKAADVVFGCLDKEGARLVLNEFCAAYDRRYIDVASDVVPGDPPEFGGKVCVHWDSPGCLVCYDELDGNEARSDIEGPIGEEQRRRIYGIERDVLRGGGPSVVSVNGVVASLGVTEFMAGVTGLRAPKGLLKYHGWTGKVTLVSETLPDCYYCTVLRGKREAADVERYIRDGVGAHL